MSWQQQQHYGQQGFQPQQTGFQQQQTGFQPQQTGYQQQQLQQPQAFQPQQTGFQQQQQPRFLNAQSTGYPSQSFSGGLQSQQTGYPSFQSTGLAPPLQQQQQPRQQNTGASATGAGNYAFLNAPPPSSSMGGMQPQQTGWQGGLQSQPTGYGGGGHSGLLAQPTGAPSRLMAQPTGVHDPRLQMMSSHFMPGDTNAPFSSSGAPAMPAPLAGQGSFQSLLSNPTVNTPKVPWTLSKQEKKDYDQIFRAWDQTGDGFINGEMAREVFGQSGLGRDDLMKIWNLSDVDNRGKLNLPEFHIAMGLIYRALNGNTIPDTLPEELIPPSMRDIDTTVTFMRDLLRHDANSRSTTSSPGFGYGSSTPVSVGQSKDAKVYKHDDTRNTTGGYKSSSRHLDRKSVRYAGEDSGAELGDLKRQLANSSAQLDQSADDFARRTEEDEALEQEVEDLKYRVKRIKDDIDYVSKGKRTPEKDEERRKLERELLFLMHEKLPEVERKQEENELRKKRDERAGARARDRRNETYGRNDYESERPRERDEYRGTFERERDYERERERDRDYRDRDRPRSRSRERRDSYDRRPRSPIATSRTPPPEPEAPSKSNHIAVPPPAPPKPTSSTPAAPSTKNMTPEERTAFIRAQAQKRIQDRLKALGVENSQSDAPVVDKSVEDRLAEEKKEAEEKLKLAESEQAAREDARKKRLEAAGGDAPKPPSAPATSASAPGAKAPPPPPTKSAMKKPPPAPTPRSQKSAPALAPAAALTPASVDPEEEELRQREEARAKAIAERKARLKKLEEEEEEERRREEEFLASRKAKAAPKEVETPAAPPPPPAPPAPADNGSYNPFHRKTSNSAAAPASAAAPSSGGFNPFFRPPATAASSSASPATSPPPPPAPPAPPAPSVRAPPQQERSAPKSAPEEDWDVIAEKDDDSDSSDDDYANSRGARGNLARALFGNILPPTSRPASAGPGSASPTGASSAPPPPKMPSAALANLGGATPADPSARGALFASIQGGARLRKAVTVDKSGPQISGRVVGDAGPPEHITAAISAPRSPSPPPHEQIQEEPASRSANRQSVDWYAGLAADTTHPSAEYQPLESTKEEQSPVEANGHSSSAGEAQDDDPTAEFDMTKDIRVRTLYPYDGQRDVDLSFIENVVLIGHPAKDPESPWWYGTLVKDGRAGWFPHAYVEELHVAKAKALYAYAGGGDEELPFEEGDVLEIVDRSDNDWWKTEKAGIVFIVPAAYLELLS